LIDRERMAKDFDQCVIVTAEVQRGAQIGAGSQGMVFRGVWRGTDVAIKDWHDGANPSYREQFRAEALKMRALPQHRNVCQFLGVLLLPSFAIVTRFYALGGLEGVVYKDRPDIAPLSKAFVRRVLLGVARGLRHLHQHGIVHRDIACRNVLLDDVSASYSAEQRASEQCDAGPVIDVAITDFGMAREGAGDSLNGMTTSRFGPIKWMSPEQIEAQRWSAASDVYSFGVLVGELLERAPPMLGLEVVDAAHMICEGTRGAIVPEPHADLRHLLKWCWEVDAAARPSMSDVVAGLKSMPLDVFVVPQTAPTKTDRKARGEANRAALALRQAQLKPPGTASGDRPPSPSLRERIGSMLRRQSNEVQPPQPPPPPVTVANPLFGVSLLNAVEADGADAHGVPLLLAQCMAMLRAHRQHSTLELSRMVGAARQQQQSAASDLYAVPNLERPASPRAALDAEANDPTTRVMHVEGIFRLSGSVAQIERVKRCALDGGQAAREALLLISDPHTIAGVMKLWLRELVDRVIDTPLMNALFDVLARERELEARIAAARRCLARASSVRRAILEQLMWICQSVVTHESVTRMTPAALAVVFAPSLTDCTLTQTKPAIDLLVFMIQNAVAIFAFEDDQDYAFLPADHTTRAERDARQIRETFVDNARLAPPETDQYGLLPARSVSPSRTPEQRSPRSLQYAQLGPEDIIAHVDLEYGDLPPED
jgi:serine/threonine protein kinase